MELAKWLVHWTRDLALRIQSSPRTIYNYDTSHDAR